jgi:hypothetical protein
MDTFRPRLESAASRRILTDLHRVTDFVPYLYPFLDDRRGKRTVNAIGTVSMGEKKGLKSAPGGRFPREGDRRILKTSLLASTLDMGNDTYSGEKFNSWA